MNRREKGELYFSKGFNCAQAVALAFSDKIGLDENTVAKFISPFGGGFGRLREVCGAVSGMMLVLGAVDGIGLNTTDENKKEIYAKAQSLMNEFKEKNGSYICRELLALPEVDGDPTPEKRTEKYYKKRPCALLVGDACEILQNYLGE